MYRTTGRTDLPQSGGREAMRRSIAALYARFPADTIVYPGHGQQTDLKSEKAAGTGIK